MVQKKVFREQIIIPKCDIAESKDYKKEYTEKKKVRACDYAWLHVLPV
jgi:hypothetical protein